jgi:hypothetical protein
MLDPQPRRPHEQFNAAIESGSLIDWSVNDFLEDYAVVGIGAELGVGDDIAKRRAVSVQIAGAYNPTGGRHRDNIAFSTRVAEIQFRRLAKYVGGGHAT